MCSIEVFAVLWLANYSDGVSLQYVTFLISGGIGVQVGGFWCACTFESRKIQNHFFCAQIRICTQQMFVYNKLNDIKYRFFTVSVSADFTFSHLAVCKIIIIILFI